MTKLSIIIPTLNEAANITRVLRHVLHNSSEKNISEITVVDCGSDDNTQELVQQLIASHNQIQLLTSERGRAKQMNCGAKNSKGTILYFLHADTFPPKHFDQLILNEVKKGHKAGCFKMKFDSSHWWLQLAGWLTQFRWRACRGGDQSQFITRELFNTLGQFNEQFTIYEDNDLINKLYKKQQFVVIQEWITTSARRYESNGIWKLQYHFWAIYVKKWCGASAEELYVYYLKHIKK
ncbi:MAG: TIGR04283 family arsenosugar biosynthesis glycosyltransferase [Flavobacteriaceae bacterium]